MNEDQLAELDGLVSVYEKENVHYDLDSSSVTGSINVEITNLNKTFKLKANIDGGEKIYQVAALSPVILNFDLSESYPEVSPELSISCDWMNKEMICSIQQKLKEVCESNAQFPVLYFCCEAVLDFVKDITETTTTFDVNHLILWKDNKCSDSKLKELMDKCDLADSRIFATQCFDCESCCSNDMGTNFVKFMPCGHIFCKDCVRSYYKNRLSTVQVKALTCLSSGCDALAACPIIKEMIGEDEYERYETILLESALSQLKDVVPCPRQGCQKPADISKKTKYLATCPSCLFSFCILCRRVYHGIDNCKFTLVDKNALVSCLESGSDEEKAKMANYFGGMEQFKIAVENVKSEVWIDSNSRKCPRCDVHIEKNEGCNKMHCIKCDVFFCWLCSAVLDKNMPYSHFTENGEAACFNRLFEILESDDEFDRDFVEDEEMFSSDDDDEIYN